MNPIKPIKLGNLNLNCNLFQGPLAGYSCAPFRLLTWRYGKPGFTTTEMISANTLVNHPKLSRKRYTWKDPDEGPVCFQLSANDPGELARATKIVTECHADLIDLNCGCPKPKIRSKGSGSKHLADPKKLKSLITAMKDNTDKPVSIKIRVDADSGEHFNDEVAQVVEDAGCDFLVVHGRHWTERYDTPCRTDEIKRFVDRLSIPVIGNGDVECADSLKKMFDAGCAGAMISRASVGRPWLFNQIKAEINGESFTPPPLNEIGEIFIEHVNRLAILISNEKFAVLQARKFGKYYSRSLSLRHNFCDKLNSCDNIPAFTQIIQQFFSDPLPQPRYTDQDESI